ncbi:MAG: hypothetical protein R2713_10390 [Ilumatobacteraceae bacterium]
MAAGADRRTGGRPGGGGRARRLAHHRVLGAARDTVLDERLVVLLADVFAEPFPAIADVLGRTPDATRQLAVRSDASSRLRARADPTRRGRAPPSGGRWPTGSWPR